MQQQMQVGLGEVILRLNNLHSKKGRGIASDDEKAEHDMLLDALNKTLLDLGFDCNGDSVPDTIEIFQASAKTSCCRIVDLPNGPIKKTKSTSRRKR